MPELRKKLRTVSSKNRALQDILRTCGDAVEVVRVEKLTGSVHNTKTILNMPDGQQRVHFYNRVPIQNTIPEGFLSSGDIGLDIEILNTLYGCDFTEDDLVITCGKYSAKPDSLGYHSEAGVAGSILPADAVTFHLNIPNNVKSQWSENIVTPIIRLRTETAPGVFTEEIALCERVGVPVGSNGSGWNNFISALYDSLLNGQLDLSTTVIDEAYVEDLDQAHTNTDSYGHDKLISNYAIEARNKTDKVIEVCIALASLYTDGIPGNPETTYNENGMWVILPNTRLLPEGFTLPYCPTADIIRFKEDDFVDFEMGQWGGGWLPENILYKGEYMGLNRATKNSYAKPAGYVETIAERPFGRLIDVDPEDAGGGLSNVLRVFVNADMNDGYSLLEDKGNYELGGNYALLLKNPFDTALEINHAFFSKPAQFAPCKNETLPDEFFLFWGNEDEIFNSEPNTSRWDITMDGVELTSGYKTRLDAILAASENNTNPKVDIALLLEPASEAVFLHIRNRSDAPVDFNITRGGEVLVADVVLAPLGTAGEKQVITDGDLEDLFEDLKANEVTSWKEYEFRGRVNEYELMAQLSLQTLNQDEVDVGYWPLSPIPEKVTVTYLNMNFDEGEPGREFEKTYFIKPTVLPRYAYQEQY